jgi:DNA-binding response OmpR family regulator
MITKSGTERTSENGNLPDTPFAMSFVKSDILPVIRVVEDDPYTLMICLRLLEKNGYSCQGFPSAEALLETAWSDDSTIVLSDIHLPGMSGVELCGIIRKQALPHVRLIALDTSLERKALLDNGFDDVLSKPFTEQSLLGVIGSPVKTALAFPLLEQLIEDPSERIKILHQFRKDTGADLALLRASIEEENPETAALLVHRLAGRFAQMDQHELALTLRELETDLRTDKSIGELYGELGSVMQEIRVFSGKLDLVL